MSIVLEITVQETVGGVLHSVAGAEVTVREETAVSQAVVIETGVSSASLSDLLLIRDDTEAARADAEASEAAALAHKNAAATSEANALNHKNAADSSKTAAAASATAAATSEANALSHKNAANSSKTAAAASETAAGNSAAAANNSKVAAAASETAAGNSAAAANNSKVAAATSEANALSHKNAADSSKAAAAASATAAAASEANALSHKNAADSSKTAAAASATAAAASEANALSHKNAADSSKAAAAASATAAATSEANALSHKNAADSSKTAAAASATAAATSEANALSHKNAADSSKTAAAVSEANALSHKNAAGVSATAASDSQASAALSAANAAASETAAAASAAQAQQYAVAVSSALIFRGGWSAAGGTYPTPSMNPETSDYYRITVGGTMTGTQGSITVTAGDYLHWDMTLDQWFKIDAVDAVTSVAGRTGDVTLTKTDVGLANVPNTDATNASNITSGTLAAARLPASINAATTGNAATATKLATARTINGVAFDGTANITIADDTKLPLTGGVLTGGLCIGDGTAAANTTVVGDLEHYLELRGTTATYPSALGVAFHHEGISTSALVHGQVNADMGYFNLRTDDPNLKVYFKDQEVWDSATGLRASKSAAGTLGNNADWDAFTLHGVYLVQMSTFSGSNNAPPAVYPFGIMHADVADFGGEQRMMQIYYPHNIDTDRCIYQRMRNAGVWTGWTKIWRGGTGDGSGLVSEAVIKTVTGTNVANLVYGNMADNDQFRIRIGGTASNSGYAEIATADDGTEPIYVRQYTGVFSSLLRTLTLLDSNGNTIIPGITYGSSFYGSSFNVSGNSDGLHTGNGDSATSTDNNVKIASWFGIGFSPSITGQPVPYGQYSHWFNVRDGSAGMRGALSQNSDIRLKENIEVIQDALAKTCTLRGIVYDRKDGGGRSTGVVAQEVQAVLPEAVTAQEDEMQTLSVAYGNMVGLLIEAIKELKGEVDNLKAEVALLKSA